MITSLASCIHKEILERVKAFIGFRYEILVLQRVQRTSFVWCGKAEAYGKARESGKEAARTHELEYSLLRGNQRQVQTTQCKRLKKELKNDKPIESEFIQGLPHPHRLH